MNTASNSFHEMADRLNKLERHNRQLGFILVCLMAAGGVVLLCAAQEAKHPSGKAETLVLRDEAGTVRARLRMGKDGPVLHFLDSRGRPLGTLGTSQDALVLGLVDQDGRLQTGLALERGGISLVSHDRNGPQTGPNALLQTDGIFTRK
jgi:hypothetical protein